MTISGRIRAHDGSPLKQGEITVSGGFPEPLTASLDETGSFSLEVPRALVSIYVAGVDHVPSGRRTLLTGPFSIDGTLGTVEPPAEPNLEIAGQFLDAQGQAVGAVPTTAARVRDRVYQLDLSGRPATATALRYQMRSPSGRLLNGPAADRYAEAGRSSFSSIVDLGDRTALQLDLGTMPPAQRPAELHWSGEDEATIAIRDFERRWKTKVSELTGASSPDPVRVASLEAEARAEVDAVADPALQGLLRGALAGVFATQGDGPGGPASVHAEAAWLIEHVAPDDVHLALIMEFNRPLRASLESGADAELAARIHAWLERRATDNPDLDAALGAMATLLELADQDDDEARLAELLAQLEHPRFQGHLYRQALLAQYDLRLPFVRGKTLPPFEYPALAPDARPIDSDGRAGHVYLLEFWATWCEPCVEDMPNLHAAYAAVNGAKTAAGDDQALRTLAPVADPAVEFVFVSFDTNPDAVFAFREQQWSMPWTHAHVDEDEHASIMSALGFTTLPASVLVDERARILARGKDLHGDRLLPTVQRVLAEREAAR
ncbi:MAG: thioredoxin-like domain-containing protein [Nannocystaceae bacterium]